MRGQVGGGSGRAGAGPAFLRVAILSAVLAALAGATNARSAVFQDELSFWSDALRKSPAKARTLNNFGRTLMVSGRPAEALPFIRRALTLAPDYLDAQFNLAIVYYDLGLPVDAEQAFTRIVAGHPGTEKARFAERMILSLHGPGQR